MSFVKYRLKEVAADFGVAPKEIVDIISKFSEKPKSNSQVLTDQELNAVFEVMTQTHQIDSLEQVFAAQNQKKQAPKAEEKPKTEAKAEPKAETKAETKAEPKAEEKRKTEEKPKAEKPKEPERKRERRVVDTSAV